MEFLCLLVTLWAILPGTYSLSSLSDIWGQKGGSVWIPCYYNIKYTDSVKFFKKGTHFHHANIIWAQNDPLHLTEVGKRIEANDDTSSGTFSITIKNLEQSDEGWYWCGLKRDNWDDRFYLYLHVNKGDQGLFINANSNVFTTREKGTLDVPCKYAYKGYSTNVKYWCRGIGFGTCATIKRSDSRSDRHSIDRVSIKDDSANQEFTVTMHSLETADSGWYWCAIEKNWADEKVAVYITVTPALEHEPTQTDITASLKSTVTNMTTSSNQRVTNDAVSRDSTGYHYEIPETYSGSEDTRVHLPIALVICGMVFLLLVAVLTLQIKRHGKEEGKNETRNVQPQEQRRTEANTESDQYATISLQKNRKEKKGTELPTEDVQYADISFGRTTEKDTEADHAEDSITYSLVHYHRKPEHHSSENFMQ